MLMIELNLSAAAAPVVARRVGARAFSSFPTSPAFPLKALQRLETSYLRICDVNGSALGRGLVWL